MMHKRELESGNALDLAKLDIANRIRKVCANLCEAEFGALVEQMAKIEIRYRLRDDWSRYQTVSPLS